MPLLEKGFVAHKRPVSNRWGLDKTYVRIKGKWKYLYRAVDKAGAPVDFLLTARRDRKAALRFLHKAIDLMTFPQRSRSTRAAPMQLQSKATMRIMTRRSRLARSST